MNKERRERLEEIHQRLLEIAGEIEEIAGEEEEAYDNLPAGIRDSERGQKMSDNVDNLYSVLTNMETIDDEIEQVLE